MQNFNASVDVDADTDANVNADPWASSIPLISASLRQGNNNNNNNNSSVLCDARAGTSKVMVRLEL